MRPRIELTDTAVAERMSSELSCDKSVAEWIIRDITAGEDYCFLMDAYKPEYM